MEDSKTEIELQTMAGFSIFRGKQLDVRSETDKQSTYESPSPLDKTVHKTTGQTTQSRNANRPERHSLSNQNQRRDHQSPIST